MWRIVRRTRLDGFYFRDNELLGETYPWRHWNNKILFEVNKKGYCENEGA